MANLCDTSYKIQSSKENIDRLWWVLETLEVNTKDIHFTNLADSLKINYEGKGYSLRGHIYWAERTSDELLSFDTETAWSACDLFFEALNEEAFNGELSISYMEMEPGCGVYYIHDEEGFFPYEYVVNAYLKDYEAYNDPYEDAGTVIDKWCETMKLERDKNMSDEEYISLIDNYEYDDNDYYFNIYKFEKI